MKPAVKYKYVDALRGIAILMVIMIHSCDYKSFAATGILKIIVESGSRGVQLFYVVSAFTLFLSFKNRIQKEQFPFRNFFIRRFFRIAPIYYLGIFYYLWQDGFGPRYWLGDATHVSACNIIANFTFLHGFNPYWITSVVPGGWSIAVEMTFYLTLPFLYMRIKSLNHAFAFFILSLVFNAGMQYMLFNHPLIGYHQLWKDYLFFFFPSQLPIFALGIVLFFIIRNKTEEKKTIPWAAIILFACMLIFQCVTGNYLFLPKHILFGIGFLLLSIALSNYEFKLIVNPVINYIGKVSYSMYVVHFAVVYWLNYFRFPDVSANIVLNYVAHFIAVVITALIISSVLFEIIEVPFQNMGKKIIDKHENKFLNRKAEL